MADLLDQPTIDTFCSTHGDWSVVDGQLVASFTLPSFPIAIDLVRDAALMAEEADHHPDIDIRWRTVTFRLSTHSAGGITDLDMALAERISSLAVDPRAGGPSGG